MVIDLDGRIFRATENSQSGDVGEGTLFHYHQDGTTVWANYNGGAIVRGHLIATLGPDGTLDMRYHHLNTSADLMTGTCTSRIEALADGSYRLHEDWQWTCGEKKRGNSVLEQVEPERLSLLHEFGDVDSGAMDVSPSDLQAAV